MQVEEVKSGCRAPASRWESALADHLAGRLAEAETAYRVLLAEAPGNADVLHKLGVLLFQRAQAGAGLALVDAAIGINGESSLFHGHRGLILGAMGRPEEAIRAYRTALRLNPQASDVWNNLGSVLEAAGDIPTAVEAYRRARAECPGLVQAGINLGLALMRTHEHGEAVAVLQNAAAMRPGDVTVERHLAAAHNNQGVLLNQGGKSAEAIAAFRRAIGLAGDFPEAHFNLGEALAAAGKYEEALGAYGEAIHQKPDFSEAHNNLGIAFFMRGRLREAIVSYGEALRHRPNYTQALNNLGNALRADNQIEEAIRTYRLVLALMPGDAEVWNNLGSALDVGGDLEAALDAFDRAIDLRPAFPQAHNNRGNTLKNLGKLDHALAAYQQAIDLEPDNQEVHSNRLYTLYFHPASSAESIYREHQQWNVAHAMKHQPATPPAIHETTGGRRLRIGYVGAAFREHCQSFFTVPLFAHHDTKQFEIIAYSDTVTRDVRTNRLRACCDAWRDIAGLADEAVAEMIRRDRIDVLVDLSAHMSQNRLMVFARKPAPVQVTWLGYPGTSGLSAMDYRLTDPYLDPWPLGGGNDRLYAEKSWRLPHTFWCYDPLTDGPPVNDLPAARNGDITFGCLNNFCKVNDGVLRLWAATLRKVEQSRLLLLAPRAARAGILVNFQNHGIGADRIEFVDRAVRTQYLATYHRIDIGLDTVPYNGHTTTLDSLWMGVPVITLVGDAPVGRAGWSQLSNLGLQRFAAASEEEFVRVAATLAGSVEELKGLRASLRKRLSGSPLMDGARFARDVERAYRAFCEAHAVV
jgi:protein O-GlcNAc transferase